MNTTKHCALASQEKIVQKQYDFFDVADIYNNKIKTNVK